MALGEGSHGSILNGNYAANRVTSAWKSTGIMVETAPGVFLVRLIRMAHLGNLPLVVIWEAEDANMVALGAPRGEIGWVWSRTAHPEPSALEAARQALVAQGYRASAFRSVEQAP